MVVTAAMVDKPWNRKRKGAVVKVKAMLLLVVVVVEVKRIKRRGRKGMLLLILMRVNNTTTTTLLMLDLHLQDHISLAMDLMVLFPSPPPCHLQPIIALHGITTWMNTQRITMHHHRCMLLATTQLILVVAIANRITPHHDRIHICICTRNTCLNTPLSRLIHRIRHNHPIHSRFSAMKTRMHVRLC
ncbi:hypothetical protein Goari_012509, partial [Gossypium aridum]|nr:hypothetical protein [Gossypium aridum]